MPTTLASETHRNVQHWPPQGAWTYSDYARLPDSGVRYEVIQGDLFMSPAPSTRHQSASFALAVALHLHVKENGLGRVFEAPIDVLLPELASPVQPDVLFIAASRLAIVKEKFIDGVPDLIVEVLSPGNPDHDRRTKFNLYAQAGVTEYWIVDPDACRADVYALRGHAYVPFGSFGPEDTAQSELLPDFRVPLRDVCANL
ncbi:MAG: Uma2 family endonuclease [Anaerolineales bacterium]|nr:Uma2 family endonuclease [Anaerolineales bacterium]